MKTTNLKVAIAESSMMLRTGLEATLKRFNRLKVQIIEIASADMMQDTLKKMQPDILIVNPFLLGNLELPRLKEQMSHSMHYIALLTGILEPSIQNMYDETISIFDSLEEIERKLENLAEQSEEKELGEEQQSLSTREKEIVVCVVKGMTNREIADNLFLSTHTVITHRRNIARKLQIRSASGLTIYAIVNKLVELDDINHPSSE